MNTGNITEEQFKNFCYDFIEKYEGRNFQELIKSLGKDLETEYKGICDSSLTFIGRKYGLGFGNFENNIPIFCYNSSDKYIFINCFCSTENDYFYTIKDLYKFFKM